TEKKQEEGWEITIKGNIGRPGSGNIEIQELSDDSTAFSDTIKMKSNYTYEKKIRLTEPGYYRLAFFKRQFVDLILDKSDVQVNVDGNSPQGFLEIKGSPDHDLIMKVQSILQYEQSTPEAQALDQEYRLASGSNDRVKMEKIQEKYFELIEKGYDSAAAVLKTAPVSLGLVNLLMNNNALDRDRYYSLYESTASRLKQEWPNSKYTTQFNEMVDQMRVTAIGSKAPEISLPTPNGDTVKLSSFKGKYVLVDFWAKWCGPCRRENPNVVRAYHKYKGNGFEVLGVSLDRSREDWLQAIQEDGLVWTHVSDLKYFDSQAAADYNISAIPFSILVDPNGVIIDKNLRGPRLDKKLAELFKKI
ncbi:MAG: redoxin domain-containing protein, partial [Bacteroidota bacterium]